MMHDPYRCKGALHASAIGDGFVLPLFRSDEGDPSLNFIQRCEGDTVISFEEVALDDDDVVLETNQQRSLFVGDRPLHAFQSRSNGLLIGNVLYLRSVLELLISEYEPDSYTARAINRFIINAGDQIGNRISELFNETAPLSSSATGHFRKMVLSTSADTQINIENYRNNDESQQTKNLPLDTILVGDCITAMESLPDNSVDMIFADPPYSLDMGTSTFEPVRQKNRKTSRSWDDESFDNYDKFTKSWLEQAKRVLKDDGTIWVIGTYHNIFRVGASLQEAGFWILNDVVWRKSNPMPNFKGSRFTNSHETMIWCSKREKSRYTFNYHAMKGLNEGLQMRSDWVLPIAGGEERIRDPWGQKVHPTQKPEALLYRVILAATHPGDVVLDPFFGTGTTGAVARRLRRRWIGIEREPQYIEAARVRIASSLPLDESSMEATIDRSAQPRVAFGMLVEAGIINPGTFLTDAKRKWRAEVLADGTLSAPQGAGSIHKLGAELQSAPSCNGWTFWHYDDGHRLVPIDQLRSTYLQSAS